MAFGAPISPNFYKTVLEIPQRPAWSSSLTKAQLHAQEEEYFKDYLTNIYSTYGADRLNHFEHNLDVWRQLWRVCERSNLVILAADARHPLLHFSVGLYRYVVDVLKKPLVLLINKIDLVPIDTLRRWQRYFADVYPGLRVVVFSSFPTITHRVALGGFNELHESTTSSEDPKGDGNQNVEDEELTELLEEISKLAVDSGANSGISSRHDLTAHAKLVAKMKKSPTLDPVGVEQLFDSCRRILAEHAQTQAQKRALSSLNMSHGQEGKELDDTWSAISLNATRLRTEKDEAKRIAAKALVRQQIKKLRAQLENLRAYRNAKADAEAQKADVPTVNLAEFDEDGDEDEFLDLSARNEMLQDTRNAGFKKAKAGKNGKTVKGKKSKKGKNAETSDSEDEMESPIDLLTMPSGTYLTMTLKFVKLNG